jgi:hypothetical protein
MTTTTVAKLKRVLARGSEPPYEIICDVDDDEDRLPIESAFVSLHAKVVYHTKETGCYWLKIGTNSPLVFTHRNALLHNRVDCKFDSDPKVDDDVYCFLTRAWNTRKNRYQVQATMCSNSPTVYCEYSSETYPYIYGAHIQSDFLEHYGLTAAEDSLNLFDFEGNSTWKIESVCQPHSEKEFAIKAYASYKLFDVYEQNYNNVMKSSI